MESHIEQAMLLLIEEQSMANEENGITASAAETCAKLKADFHELVRQSCQVGPHDHCPSCDVPPR